MKGLVGLIFFFSRKNSRLSQIFHSLIRGSKRVCRLLHVACWRTHSGGPSGQSACPGVGHRIIALAMKRFPARVVWLGCALWFGEVGIGGTARDGCDQVGGGGSGETSRSWRWGWWWSRGGSTAETDIYIRVFLLSWSLDLWLISDSLKLKGILHRCLCENQAPSCHQSGRYTAQQPACLASNPRPIDSSLSQPFKLAC